MKRFTICLLIAIFALSFNHVNAQCMTPDSIKTGVVTDNSAAISWQDQSGAANDSLFVIRYFDTQVPGPIYYYKKVPYTTTNITLTNLASSTTYQYSIESYCTFRDKSDYSTGINFTTPPPACKMPAGLTITKITTHSATFSWSGNGSKYSVQYKVLGASAWSYKSTSNETLTINNLLSNTTYVWQVKSICYVGKDTLHVYATGPMFNTLVNQCYPPTVLIPTDIESNSITIEWDRSPDATSFKVEWWIKGDSLNTHYYPKKGQLALTINSFRLPSLSVDTRYEIAIKTMCKYTNDTITTEYSRIFQFATKVGRCSTPANLKHDEISTTSARLNWTPCPIANYYVLKYYKKEGNVIDSLNTHYRKVTAAPPYVLTGLQPGGFTWGWEVKAKYNYSDVPHTTPYSAEDVFSTPAHRLMANGNSSLPEMLVYPNPSNGNFNLSLNNNSKYDFAIYNIQGALVYSETNNAPNTIKSINLTGFSKGIYFLRVLSNSEVKTSKLLIQ